MQEIINNEFRVCYVIPLNNITIIINKMLYNYK